MGPRGLDETLNAAPVERLRQLVDRAGWQPFALLGVLVTAAYLNIWQLSQNGYGNTYYAAAVRSMTQSWHNFFYNSFDPAGFITVDKPPVALWIQAAFARVFGYSGMTLLLPEALAGMGSVLLVYLAVSRVFGRTAGVVGAFALALTPISVAVDRSNNLDAWLIFFVTLSAYAMVRALEKGNLRWLLASALFMGIAFNTKFLAAYVALPALWFAYLATAPLSLRTRIAHLVAATVLLAVVSSAWVVAFDLTPAASRPYAGGSSTNSMLNLLIDYNGLGRIDGEAGPASGVPGLFRLFGSTLASQAMWLTPLALIGGIAAAFAAGRRLRGNAALGSVLLWGGWLLTAGAVFSFAQGIFHDYYLSFLGPPMAALAGIGVVTFARGFSQRSWLAFFGPVALIATGLLELKILGYTPDFKSWLVPSMAIPVFLAAVVLLVNAVRREPATRATVAALAIGVGALLLPAAVWSATVTGQAGNGTLPSANVAGASDGFGRPGNGQAARPDFQNAAPFGRADGGRQGQFASPPPAGFDGRAPQDGAQGGIRGGPGGGRGSVDQDLLAYLEANRGDATYLVAVESSMQASSTIIATGEPVMAMGGFNGSDPALSVEQLAELVEQGKLRFVMLSGAGGGGAIGGRGGPGGNGGGNTATIQAIEQVGKVVDSSQYGGSSAGGTLYDLQGLADALRQAGG